MRVASSRGPLEGEVVMVVEGGTNTAQHTQPGGYGRVLITVWGSGVTNHE